MALAIEALGAVGFPGCVAAAGNDGQSPFVLDLLTRSLAIVCLVAGNGERLFRRVQHVFDDLTVVDLSARHCEVQRPTFAVDDCVDFRRSPAPADADRLIFLPPYGWPAPPAVLEGGDSELRRVIHGYRGSRH